MPELARVLPEHISPDKFVRTAETALGLNPDLWMADPKSVFAACMKCAQDGLYPDGKEAAMVVFNSKNSKTQEWEKKAQYMPMVGGLRKKLHESGHIASMSENVVYENDTFEYELGDNERIIHKPTLKGRGEPIGVYAIVKTKDGAVYREIMGIDEVEKIRSVSKGAEKGPWKDWWSEMAKKTVLRRIYKRLPSNPDVDKLLNSDNETYDIKPAALEQSPTQLALAEETVVEDPKKETEGDADGW